MSRWRLERNETRETLIECARRPNRRSCVGLMSVVKTEQDAILAHCVLCQNEEAFIHNWQETDWAKGMMDPVPIVFEGAEQTTH